MEQVKALVLAAGKGTRMKSELPKVLHKVAGKTMLSHVIEATKKTGVDNPIVIVGHLGHMVKDTLGDTVEFIFQHQQLGTGHAVMQAEESLKDFKGPVFVLCGDTPLIRTTTLQKLLSRHVENKAAATVLTAVMENPTGYGRIIRNSQGAVEKIVEEKDGVPEELAVKEINTGAYCFNNSMLFKALKEISPANAQGEFYLTDVLEIFVKRGLLVQAEVIEDSQEMMGINNRLQLSEAEQLMRQRKARELMLSGVTIVDPNSTFVDNDVEIGQDSIIYPFTIIEGSTKIGKACSIGPSSRLVDVEIGNQVVIQNSILLKSCVGNNSTIGPFAYIRPDTQLAEDVKVGDFVELKKSQIGKGSKIPHLSYVGDSIVGQKVNIGAGTITCNYDGVKKSQTIIESGAFIGSNTNLVAPVEVGQDAVIAAGSTITKNVPANALGLERSKQVNVPNWKNKVTSK